MIDLKLLSKLQGSDTVTLALQRSPGRELYYYIVSQSINYVIVSSGKCNGTLGGFERRMFNISLSGLVPLLDRGFKFEIQYIDEILEFVSTDGRMHFKPLCVEYNDTTVQGVLSKYLRFSNALEGSKSVASNIKKTEWELQNLIDKREESIKEEISKAAVSSSSSSSISVPDISLMQLETMMTSANPFGPPDLFDKLQTPSTPSTSSNTSTTSTTSTTSDISVTSADQYIKLIEEKQLELKRLREKAAICKPVDLKAFRTFANAASRYKGMINFCSDYAIIEIGSVYLLQKGDCPIMAVPGFLLYTLLTFEFNSEFYWFENGLVFIQRTENNSTVVFLEKYLPNAKVDKTIATRGKILEKYTTNMRNILTILSATRSKFPNLQFDMGASKLILTNDNGETLESKFDITSIDTLDIRKMKADSSYIPTGSMANIIIPHEVQSLLSLFRDQLTIYVLKRKIMFQAGTLCLVFGRVLS